MATSNTTTTTSTTTTSNTPSSATDMKKLTDRPPESMREEFRRYLEKSGVIESLNRVMLLLMKEDEKPYNPTDFFLENLVEPNSIKVELDSLRRELSDMEKDYASMTEENYELKVRLAAINPEFALLELDDSNKEEEEGEGDLQE